MTVSTSKLGPGTLKLGPTATVLDVSCQLITAQVEWSKDKDDDETTLCGDVVPGDTTYTATLSGTFFQDLAEAAGVVAYTWANYGQAVDFEYVPNTVDAATVTGQVVVDPLTVGGDEPTKRMRSDFEWDCVGEPTITFSGVALEAGTELDVEADAEADAVEVS